MADLDALRATIRQRYQQAEPQIVEELLAEQKFSEDERTNLAKTAAEIVAKLRADTNPTIMESFLSEYGLSTKEGVGLMCLAEALLRVPDATTVDELIADKIEPSDWGLHLGQSSSSLVNASTWALMLTGQVLDDGTDSGNAPVVALRGLIKRVGEPVVRTAVSQAMKMLGKQFVLGQTIESAINEATDLEQEGYTYSYDMLGEAARTHADAARYCDAYADAIKSISKNTRVGISERPGISVKLSALYPRYETTHKEAVMQHLLPRIQSLVKLAADADIGLNIDAEEADRLDLSLDIIEALLADKTEWQGFGIVVQAYSRRALPVIDWLLGACKQYDRKVMVRLVKGAYWDAEIKLAQELGLANFPVYTRKANTDLSYIVCAQRLLDNRSMIYPQFATHNAHTVAAIRYMAGEDTESYEFQRLHGMGEALHDLIMKQSGTHCRIYAPVGAHVDLLAYLVRRLLENGANSSFVNQIVNTDIAPEDVGSCPITEVINTPVVEHPSIVMPLHIYSPERHNSKGYRINDPASISPLLEAREKFKTSTWDAIPMISQPFEATTVKPVLSPTFADITVGTVIDAEKADVENAIEVAAQCVESWQSSTSYDRAGSLTRAAELYEENIAELSALLSIEAGKHLNDAISEVREAVDFLRYYAARSMDHDHRKPRGVIVCISPWNFPLAIFTGQLAAAIAAGNVVIAKPAEQTPLIAAKAVELLHQAAIPNNILQMLPGEGATVGQALIEDPRIAGVCFTGSTAVAKHIEQTLCERNKTAKSNSDPMLIAETGGLNAMIADTTALTEQVVRDVLISSFQSAGQRCSALRMLYVQEEAYERLLEMLRGAIETLNVGDPWLMETDVGPVIDAQAKNKIDDYVLQRKVAGQLIANIATPEHGHFVGPAIIRVSGIEELEEEIFGPILHVATFKAEELDATVDAINAKGYGLTFALHTRIDDRVQQVVERIRAGNVYVNRNQIGAVVGTQPFGGEGLSGTGPKAGGPNYLEHFYTPEFSSLHTDDHIATANSLNADAIRKALRSVKPLATPLTSEHKKELQALSAIGEEFDAELTAIESDWLLPGPTGESNRLTLHPRGHALVMADNTNTAMQLCADALIAGCAVVVVTPSPPDETSRYEENLPVKFLQGTLQPEYFGAIDGIDVVALGTNTQVARKIKQVVAHQKENIMPVVTSLRTPVRFAHERHVCIDTTAAGGNATLLAAAE